METVVLLELEEARVNSTGHPTVARWVYMSDGVSVLLSTFLRAIIDPSRHGCTFEELLSRELGSCFSSTSLHARLPLHLPFASARWNVCR